MYSIINAVVSIALFTLFILYKQEKNLKEENEKTLSSVQESLRLLKIQKAFVDAYVIELEAENAALEKICGQTPNPSPPTPLPSSSSRTPPILPARALPSRALTPHMMMWVNLINAYIGPNGPLSKHPMSVHNLPDKYAKTVITNATYGKVARFLNFNIHMNISNDNNIGNAWEGTFCSLEEHYRQPAIDEFLKLANSL